LGFRPTGTEGTLRPNSDIRTVDMRLDPRPHG